MTHEIFTIDEARILVEALEHDRMSGPPDEEEFIGRTPLDPQKLPDYVAARKQAYAEEAQRRADRKRDLAELGMEYTGREPLRIGENVDLDAFVARLRALEPAERARIVQKILDMLGEELDEDGNPEPDPGYLRFTYQYLSAAGLIDRPARPYQVVGYWYEREWEPPAD